MQVDAEVIVRPAWMLFSFRGRISRSQYWLARIVLSVLFVTLLVAAYSMADWVEARAGFYAYLLTLVIVADLIVAWSGLALDVKRLHDHGLSAGWVAFALVPVLGVVLPPLVFYFLRGTPGTNRYGPDPVPHELAPTPILGPIRPKRRLLKSLF
jgi:uncharacterized membrane protein YhaH (DUF805 family)